MTDLPTRLRAMAGQIPGTEDCYEAANYIERLEEAFRPFVTILPPQANVYDFEHIWVSKKDYAKALETLENKNV